MPSRKEIFGWSQDIADAMTLFWGIDHGDKIKKTQFPSAHTKPTEKEAMAALSRVLHGISLETVDKLAKNEVLFC